MASKKRVLKVKRKKKVWFKVLSPEVYGKREIGEITAFEAKNLIGRVIKLSARDLTTSRDQNQKISLRVTEVKGDTAETEVIKSNIVDSVVQKKSRKIKERIEKVFTVNLKSGESIRIKILLTTQKAIARPIHSAIVNALPKQVESLMEKKSLDEVFTIEYKVKLSKELQKRLSKIYPISNVYVWKLGLV